MIEAQLREALTSMQKGIKESDAKAISTSLNSLDTLLKSHRSELDPQLAHYLSRRSYEKALMHLEGQTGIPKGRCG